MLSGARRLAFRAQMHLAHPSGQTEQNIQQQRKYCPRGPFTIGNPWQQRAAADRSHFEYVRVESAATADTLLSRCCWIPHATHLDRCHQESALLHVERSEGRRCALPFPWIWQKLKRTWPKSAVWTTIDEKIVRNWTRCTVKCERNQTKNENPFSPKPTIYMTI